ncbi:MAG: hypothetical protein ACREE0_11330 [Phenylobacterium sp.]
MNPVPLPPWSNPDAQGISSIPGMKRLSFQHQGRDLDVRAAYDAEHAAWLVAVKEGDRFVAPHEAFAVSNDKIYDAKRQGGMFAELLTTSMVLMKDAVEAGKVVLIAKAGAPTALKWNI